MLRVLRAMSSSAASSTSAAGEGPVGALIRRKLTESFTPSHLHVECESRLHNVPRGAEKHFHVQVVSDRFEGLSVIQRHRLVNECLADELAGPVHALRIDAIPTSKFVGQKSSPPPPCLGGGKH